MLVPDHSQGSVATYVRYGGMSTESCTANFLLSLSVIEFVKSVKIWQSYCQSLGASFFWNTVYFIDIEKTQKVVCV